MPVLLPNIDAITLGHVIFIRRGREHDRLLLAHELVHVEQWAALGYARFVWSYLYAYARNRVRGLPHWSAYRAIPLEVDARTMATQRLGNHPGASGPASSQ